METGKKRRTKYCMCYRQNQNTNQNIQGSVAIVHRRALTRAQKVRRWRRCVKLIEDFHHLFNDRALKQHSHTMPDCHGWRRHVCRDGGPQPINRGQLVCICGFWPLKPHLAG